MDEQVHVGARDRNRTGTVVSHLGILSRHPTFFKIPSHFNLQLLVSFELVNPCRFVTTCDERLGRVRAEFCVQSDVKDSMLRRLQAFLLAICEAVRAMRLRNLPPVDPSKLSQELIERGLQYYVSGRYATIAGYLPVAANLYHHAIEMLLKGSLAKTHTEARIRSLHHNLKRAWRLFKAGAKDPTLDKLDSTVAQLNKFEDLRYPNMRHGMFVVIYFGPEPEEPRGVGGERYYKISATEVDELVKAIFDHSPHLNPKFFQNRFRTKDAQEFFLMHNEHPIWTSP